MSKLANVPLDVLDPAYPSCGVLAISYEVTMYSPTMLPPNCARQMRRRCRRRKCSAPALNDESSVSDDAIVLIQMVLENQGGCNALITHPGWETVHKEP
jgi:hypothetical protein